MEPMYQVFGSDDGSGTRRAVRRSRSTSTRRRKTVNVVRVPSLDDALVHVNVATQTIGIYPEERAAELRDKLAARGMQRLVPLGEVIQVALGLPARRLLSPPPIHEVAGR